ncbi:MAG: hypothetical protein H6R17_264 [Proteobacteria bacterium]|nr:hypothetical protein [Pseudomonadota bacterium]
MMTASARSPAEANAATASVSHSSRLTLLWLVVVFLLPFVVGSGLFWLDWRPTRYANHGELLQPPRALPATGLRRIDGSSLPSGELRGKWLLVVPAQRTCDEACAATQQQLAQVQLALNQNQGRVQRVLVVSGSDPQNLAKLQRRFPDLLIAGQPSEAGAFDGRAAGLYVADPQARLILRYGDPTDMRGVLKDLERLLKYSWLR